MTVIYSPPYDSPIEDALARYSERYFSEETQFVPQVEVGTICGTFRLDFLAQHPNGMRTAFECDGKEFHNASRDEWRDAMILGSGSVDEIYRISGADITYRLDDVFYAISVWSPWLFDARQTYNISRNANEQLLKFTVDRVDTRFSAYYLDSETNRMTRLDVEKRHKVIPEGRRQFWQSAYKFAVDMGGGNLDDVISKYRAWE